MTSEEKLALACIKGCIKEHRGKIKEGLELALEMLRTQILVQVDLEQSTKKLSEAIGNIYKFHADQELDAFDQGYNSAIRDVLTLLERGDTICTD